MLWVCAPVKTIGSPPLTITSRLSASISGIKRSTVAAGRAGRALRAFAFCDRAPPTFFFREGLRCWGG